MSGNEGAILPSVLEAIGKTPLVELSRLTAGCDGRILAKLEFLNPGGSKKDRVALQILKVAEASGELRPGQPVVELTSGNTGAGAAIVCAVLGHPFIAVMSAGNSVERAQMMRALGAEVVLVAQVAGSRPGQVSGSDLERVEACAADIVKSRKAFRLDQFHRKGNYEAHEATGAEFWRQSGGCITAFCDFVGTGGTFAGVTMALRAQSKAIRTYIVEPSGAAVLAGCDLHDENHRIQGGGYSMRSLPLLDEVAPDGYITVTDSEALSTARDLAIREGIFVGISSGANVAAALKLLSGPEKGGVIAVVLNDTGQKYFSTELWS